MRYFNYNEDLEFILTEETEVTFEKHNHISKYVAGIVLNGTVEIVEHDRTIVCHCDDIFIVPIYSVHSLHLNHPSTRLLTMCVGIQFINQNSLNEAKEILVHNTNELQKQNIIDGKKANAFEDAMDLIFTLYHEQKLVFPEPINEINQLIINNPQRQLDLESLAKQIYISKYYMIKKFKETIGLTPHNFQIQNRIRRAQYLLGEGWTVIDVAMELGFYDQSHFVKSFKYYVGLTPSEYIHSLEKLK